MSLVLPATMGGTPSPGLPTQGKAAPQVILTRLLHAIPAPPELPNLARVVSHCRLALERYAQDTDVLGQEMRDVINDIVRLDELFSTSENRSASQPLALFHRKGKFPCWSLFSSHDFPHVSRECLDAAGAELAASLIAHERFRDHVALQLVRLGKPTAPESVAKQLENALDLRRRVFRRTKKISEKAMRGLDADDLHNLAFSMRVEMHFIAQMTTASIPERKAAGSLGEQTAAEIAATGAELRARVESGDNEALLQVMAFLLGLPLELACQAPLVVASPIASTITIDINQGLIRTDLGEIVTGAALPGYPDCLPATRQVARPLPQFVQEALRQAISGNPAAKYLGDLDPDGSWQLPIRHRTSQLNPAARICPSLARFIHSRASIAIRLGIDRAVAAYLTNDFTKIGHAKHYYLHIQREEIWHAATILFAALGWGEPTPAEMGPGFGSAVTPSRELLVRRNEWMCQEVDKLRPGHRYTLASLQKHHNAFALLCADRFAMLLGGRAQRIYRFFAESFSEDSAFLQLQDKRVGMLAGMSPVAIPALVREQAKFWFAHCRALDARLEHLGLPPRNRIRRHINSVLNQAPVPMFFMMRNDDVVPVGSGHVSAWPPPALQTKPDHGRHFWQNALRHAGLPSTEVDLFMRHTVRGQEAFCIESLLVLRHSFSRITSAQNGIILQLGMQPVVGLSRGKK